MSRLGTAKSATTKGPPRRGDGGRGTVPALIRGGLSGCRERVACRTGRAGGSDRVDRRAPPEAPGQPGQVGGRSLTRRGLLGFGFFKRRGEVKVRIDRKAIMALKARIRRLTAGTGGCRCGTGKARQWAGTRKGSWRLAGSAPLQRAIPHRYWANLGVLGFIEAYGRVRAVW
jgi:hypothetical protein